MGVGFEFDVIVVVVMGGMLIFGGCGVIFGMLVGVLLFGVFNNGFNMIGVNLYV